MAEEKKSHTCSRSLSYLQMKPHLNTMSLGKASEIQGSFQILSSYTREQPLSSEYSLIFGGKGMIDKNELDSWILGLPFTTDMIWSKSSHASESVSSSVQWDLCSPPRKDTVLQKQICKMHSNM